MKFFKPLIKTLQTKHLEGFLSLLFFSDSFLSSEVTFLLGYFQQVTVQEACMGLLLVPEDHSLHLNGWSLNTKPWSTSTSQQMSLYLHIFSSPSKKHLSLLAFAISLLESSDPMHVCKCSLFHFQFSKYLISKAKIKNKKIQGMDYWWEGKLTKVTLYWKCYFSL